MKALRWIVGILALAWLPAVAAAQSATSGAIAGTVKDTTGAVLPGVTVEAASPALIEKVRSAVTDGEGNYRIVDLRPGAYTVTFTLPGFAAVKREGIALTTGFTATIDADLQVGDVSETITVTGQSPVVDVQNTRMQNVITSDILESAPAGSKDQFAMAAMTVGARATGAQDVGGNQGSNGGGVSYHGINSSDSKFHLDGTSFNSFNGNGGGSMLNWRPNKMAVTEMNLGLGSQGAEFETAGLQWNLVPREGSNLFQVSGTATYMNQDFQGSNFTDEIRARGLSAGGQVKRMWDYGLSIGGPIQKDRAWFVFTPQWWGVENINVGASYNATQHTPLYTPDFSRPGIGRHWFNDYAGRVTWQITSKDKVNAGFSIEEGCGCSFTGSPTLAPEGFSTYRYSPRVIQGTWTRPQTNRLLLQAGGFFGLFRLNTVPTGDVLPTDISTVDVGPGRVYRAAASAGFSSSTSGNYQTGGETNPLVGRFTVSYVTGSHAFKIGVEGTEGFHNWGARINQNLQYIFLNTVPISLTQYSGPFSERLRLHKRAVYAQDQWTVKNVTLNLGVRYDSFNGTILAHTIAAGDFVPERPFPQIDDVPDFKDITPRAGAAWDVFGDGRTAVKASAGRYVASLGSSLTEENNPALLAVNNISRSWSDVNGNYNPDCSLTSLDANGECGAVSNRLFGQVVPGTRFADNVLRGWGNRTYSWQTSVALQQELRPGLSATVGYFRNWYGNILVNVNEAVTAADFTAYCVTVPVNPRLPGGGGNQVCGNYDVNPNKFGQVRNFVQQSSDFGADITRVYNGAEVTLNGRFGRGAYLSGGLNIGRIVLDDCSLNAAPHAFATGNGFVVDSSNTSGGGVKHPGTTEFCHVAPPWNDSYQVKFLGGIPLPYAFEVSGVFQNLPGVHVQTANAPNICVTTTCLTYTNAQVAPALGRNLAAGPAGTVTLAIVPPQTLFEDRLTQLDLRVTKALRFGKARVKGILDIYNVFNSSSIQRVNGNYGPLWLQAQIIMAARYAKVGAQIDF